MKVETPIAVGHIPSGLFIVCTKDGDQKEGFLASWVQQVSFDPLLVSFAIKPDRRPYAAIVSGQVFTINIVGEHATQYLKPFWSGYGENPFADIDHQVSPRGGILIEAAKSVIEARMVSQFQPGDHQIIVAEVLDSHVFHRESRPKVHIRKSGLDY